MASYAHKLMGTAYNAARGQSINIYIHGGATQLGYKRLMEAVPEDDLNRAYDKTKNAFEANKLFNDDDMSKIGAIYVTNMSHKSPSDADAHFTVKGEEDSGSDVKTGHVKEDESKQEQAW